MTNDKLVSLNDINYFVKRSQLFFAVQFTESNESNEYVERNEIKYFQKLKIAKIHFKNRILKCERKNNIDYKIALFQVYFQDDVLYSQLRDDGMTEDDLAAEFENGEYTNFYILESHTINQPIFDI